MKHFNILFSALLLGFSQVLSAQSYLIPSTLKSTEYVHNRLIFKIKEQYRSSASEEGVSNGVLQAAVEKMGGGTLHKNFKGAKPPGKKTDKTGERYADLSLIYELNYAGEMNIQMAATLLQKSGIAEWIQPRYTAFPMSQPNDPQISQQYHHGLIKTFEAWDFEDGDSTVVIGITDGGIQFTHEDLGNVKYNYADPINGIDDDNDGFIDNFRGWNTANNTNDPTATLTPHGMFVAGLSSAKVNNSLGIAGNGFNCKFLPIRIDDASGFNYGYEGIVYAADHGCLIINASWGNTFPTPMNEEVIRYATINKGSLVIASAGNSHLNEKYYPASYPFVVSVGATNASDVKWTNTNPATGGSTFGPSLDISAPGELVRSCLQSNTYGLSSGTSEASPLVSGAAALVKSHFPQYTALQIGERLKVTADTTIYSIPGNSAFRDLLGAGRLNMLRAITDGPSPSVHLRSVAFTDNDGDNFPEPNDEISIGGEFFNFLDPTTALVATLSCSSPYIQIITNQINLGVIGTLQGQTPATPFKFSILPGMPINQDILLKVVYSDGNYRAVEFLELRVNRDYMDLTENRIHTTITSRGNIGYNADYATDGLGFRYDGSESMIYYSGFVLGTSAAKVADNAYAATLPGYNTDFTRVNAVSSVITSGTPAIHSSYSTTGAAASSLVVNQKSRAFSDPQSQRFVFVEYTVVNPGITAITGVYGGIFTDWDIENAATNKAVFDASRKLSYAYNTAPGGLYGGVKLLSGQPAKGYSLNSDGTGGSINMYNGFSEAEKFSALSGSPARDTTLTGDVANMISAGPFDIPAGDSITLTFALLAGDFYDQIRNSAERAQAIFNVEHAGFSYEISSGGCDDNTGILDLAAENPEGIAVYLSNGDGVILNSSVDISAGYNYAGLPPGSYSLRVDFADNSSFYFPFEIETIEVVTASLEASSVLVGLPNAEVSFTGNATGASEFSWDFGDNTSDTAQNPVHTYQDTGTYVVYFTAISDDCSATDSVEIQVGTTVGMKKISRAGFQVYPNPASTVAIIQFRADFGAATIKVYTASGQLLVSEKTADQQYRLNTSTYATGTYIVEVFNEVVTERMSLIIHQSGN